MSKRDFTLYILDIFVAFDKIQRYTKSFSNGEELLNEELHWDGTIRELEIIGEATNYLLKAEIIDRKHRRIVDFRNQIIHGYFGVDENIVFDVVKNGLPKYIEELKILVRKQNIDLTFAIESAKVENARNKKVISFLDTL
jgi:uncharacterized protein with HEPN domain